MEEPGESPQGPPQSLSSMFSIHLVTESSRAECLHTARVKQNAVKLFHSTCALHVSIETKHSKGATMELL